MKVLVDGFEFDGEIYRSLSEAMNRGDGHRMERLPLLQLPATEESNGKE